MSDLLLFIDFVVDIVCMMPPFAEVEAIGITRNESVLISLAAIGLLVLSITISSSKEMLSDNSGAAVVVAICVVGIGFIGLDREMLTSLFVSAYPPMVISMRFAEGAMVGGRTSRYLRWWHFLLLGGAIVAAYLLLRSLPGESMAYAKGGWAILGAGAAALVWTRAVADAPMFRGPFSTFAIFAVFASTLTYVSVSPFECSFYQWSLPVGLVVGIIGGRTSGGDVSHNAHAAGS